MIRPKKAYGNLGNTYQSLGDYQKAIEYHEKVLKIAKEVADRGGREGGARGILDNASLHRVTIKKPLNVMKNV